MCRNAFKTKLHSTNYFFFLVQMRRPVWLASAWPVFAWRRVALAEAGEIAEIQSPVLKMTDSMGAFQVIFCISCPYIHCYIHIYTYITTKTNL